MNEPLLPKGVERSSVVPTSTAGDWEQARAAFLASRRSRETRRAYAAALDSFAAHAGGIPGRRAWPDVTTVDVASWRDAMLAERRHATVRHRLAALAAFFKFAARRRLYPTSGFSPVEDVERPPAQAGRAIAGPKGLLTEHVRALLANPDPETLRGARDRALLLALAHCGLRRAEVGTIQWGQLGQATLTPVVPYRRKGMVEDTRTLDAVTASAIRRYARSSKHIVDERSYVFPGGHGRAHLSPDGVYKIVRRHAEAALSQVDARSVHPHALRHTAAQLLQALEISPQVIQNYLRHANLQTTQVYLGEQPRQDAEMAALIGRTLAGDEPAAEQPAAEQPSRISVTEVPGV